MHIAETALPFHLTIHLLLVIHTPTDFYVISPSTTAMQLYYAYYSFGDPMHYKSDEQQQLLEHSHHPIFLGPLIILWVVPVMTYDRLLVALMLPLYVYVGCGSIINDEDVSYVKDQFDMKRRQLLANGVG